MTIAHGGLLIWILVLVSVQRSIEPYRGFYQYGVMHERSDTRRILVLRVVLLAIAIYIFGLHGVWLLLSTLVHVLLYLVLPSRYLLLLWITLLWIHLVIFTTFTGYTRLAQGLLVFGSCCWSPAPHFFSIYDTTNVTARINLFFLQPWE